MSLRAVDNSDHRSRRKRLPMLWLAGLLILVNLACFQVQQTVIFDQDGSGSGVVKLEMLMPRRIGDELLIPNDLVADLTEQGWQNVQVTKFGPDRYKITGDFYFGDKPGERPLKEVLPTFTLTIEEAENNYRYYTYEGNTDFTELASFWETVQNDWAINGFRAEDEEGLEFPLFGEIDLGAPDKDGYILTPAEVQQVVDSQGPPKMTITVFLPGQTPVDANGAWSNASAYLAGQSEGVTFTWQPGKSPTVDLKVQRRLEPLTTVSEAEAQAQIEKLLKLYETAIPAGKYPIVRWATGPLAGHLNNNLTAFFNGDNYICSDYQERVLRWLNTIRTSPDENTRNLLKGLDYGPIQTNGGGHRAVVLFRRDTDWRQTGLVLDPWPYQRPGTWSIGNWSVALWGFSESAKKPEPDGEMGYLYPHLTGKTSSYPASYVLQGDLAQGLARPTRILMVRSPVLVMVTLADGRRIGGLSDGLIVNDLPGEADFYALPKDDTSGEMEWLLFLPETDFEVELSGTGAGNFHAVLATPQGYTGFGPQPIEAGQQATFSSNAAGQLSPLTRPDGSTVPPRSIAPEQLDIALGIPIETVAEIDQPPPAEAGQPPTAETDQLLPSEPDPPPTEAGQPSSVEAEQSSIGAHETDGQPLDTVIGLNSIVSLPYWLGGLVLVGVMGLGFSVGLLAGSFLRRKSPAPPADAATPFASVPQVYASAPPGPARLVIQGPEGYREQPLSRSQLLLGRGSNNDLVLSAAGVSRQHAMIWFENGRYIMRDLGSANGVAVNGQLITTAVYLSPGDVIQISQYTLTFVRQT